ncbi:MAG TPA: glycosyltransferase [Ktedonobacteraceae bacterium]|jgi:glycosyltransferase involved in cell wall biosynthesis|nr:glycosyltransferase [Ktedonobacteraceae bacterium]
MKEDRQLRICVVGAGTRFLGGISYYTLHLVNALASNCTVSAIVMRQLLPTRLYPGHRRVGTITTQLAYDSRARVFDGVDWYWLPSMLRALLFLRRERPDIVTFQWWSATVLHSYLLLALAARLLHARVVIEFHEVLDPGEATLPLVSTYVRLLAPLLLGLAHGYVVHSEHDRKLLTRAYRLGPRPVALIGHGPYASYAAGTKPQAQQFEESSPACLAGDCKLLFFGLIRPYKGLEDLIRAFNALPASEIEGYRLIVVGETWEGCTQPATLIEQSPYRERITFVNRYVADNEVAGFFAAADAAILPYRRASSSGALHIAMSCGLPVVVTRVGGLVEAVAEYEGTIIVPPGDVEALRDALRKVAQLRGRRYRDPHSWDRTVDGYMALIAELRSNL